MELPAIADDDLAGEDTSPIPDRNTASHRRIGVLTGVLVSAEAVGLARADNDGLESDFPVESCNCITETGLGLGEREGLVIGEAFHFSSCNDTVRGAHFVGWGFSHPLKVTDNWTM